MVGNSSLPTGICDSEVNVRRSNRRHCDMLCCTFLCESHSIEISCAFRYFQLQNIIFGFTVYDLMGMKNSAVWLKVRERNCYRKIKVYFKALRIVIKLLISPFLFVPWLAFYVTTGTVIMLMSMFSWGLLALLCRNKCMCFLTAEPDNELKIYENVLKSVVIYGEDPASLFIANSRSFENIKSSMKGAFDKGKACTALINLMRSNYSDGNFVDQLKHFVDQRPEFEEMLSYFPGVSERTWRMTALSLVKMITEVGDSLSPDDEQSNSIVQEAVLAYKQARDLMDFADCPDNVQVNTESFSMSNMEAFLLRYKAETDFRDLKNMYRHWKFGRRVNRDDDSVVEALDKCTPKFFQYSACISNLFKASLYNRNLVKNCGDPCQSIDMLNSATRKHFQRLKIKVRIGYLANVVCQSLSGLLENVVESCNKWAAEFEEEKISKAIDIAGKAWAVMEESREGDFATAQFFFGEIESKV
ncbi:hypothetical protein SUGI_0079290 [Cryptomeria japonica]|nr:hypothetical protein SUGI_0079290 [Cryptomeria japonica]